jgi:antirestriction protein ArdC
MPLYYVSTKQETPMAHDVYQNVTDRIIAAIETGDLGKWSMPWHTSHTSAKGLMQIPVNINGREYRGINVWLLISESIASGFGSAMWGTYKAWTSAGGQVRKGSKGTKIVFWQRTERKITNETGDDEIKKGLLAREYTVFNLDQVDGYETKAIPQLPEDKRIANAEAFFNGIDIQVQHGGNRACYIPAIDTIQLPVFEQFKAAEHYYSTRGHETIHATGHESRLNREFGKRFGDAAYAMEELVAELGAAFLCARLQLDNEPRPDHAQYLAGWLTKLKADKTAIFTAASKAQAAVDFLYNAQEEIEQEAEAA